MKKLFILLPLVFALFQTAGAQKKLRVTPQWLPQAQFAGIYAAQAMGFYQEAGLEVEIIHPSATHSSDRMLKEGVTDIITLQLVGALTLWERGFKLTNVLQTSENAAQLIVSRNALTSPDELNGKRIGHWKTNFSILAYIFCKQRNLSIEWIPFHSNIALYISGAIDATTAMEYNEYFQLKMAGRDVGKGHVIAMRDYGLNIQEDGVYVKPEFLEKNREDVRKFVEATQKGWEWVRKAENREKAIDIVMEVQAKNKVYSNRVHQKYMLNTILRLQENEAGVAPYALTRERFEEAVNLFMKEGLLSAPVPYTEFVNPFISK